MKFRNIGLAVVGLAVFSFALGLAPNAEAHTTPSPVAQKTYVTVAWEMPKAPVNSTSPTWPQKYYKSAKTNTPNLNALDSALDSKCGVPYQVDVYFDNDITKELINGKHLDGPNNPKEALVPGGWGVSYKLVYNPFQNKDPKGKCYVAPHTKAATTVVTTDAWECDANTAVTHTVTTTYTFVFDTETGTYGPAVAHVGAAVTGTRVLTNAEFKPCATSTPTPSTTPTTASSTPTKPASSSSQPTTSSSTPSVVTSQPVTSQPVSESTPPVVVHAELADTGSSITLWLILGAAFLVAAGAVVVAASRRKK